MSRWVGRAARDARSVDAAQLLAETFGAGYVRVGSEADQLRIGAVLADLGGYAERQGAGGHLHARGHHRVGPDQRTRAHDGAVQDDGAVAHQRAVLDRAALEVDDV